MTPQAPGASSGTAPLAGVVVVELGSSVAAPFAGPDPRRPRRRGDQDREARRRRRARKWGPPFWEGAAASFQPLNRGKKSVVCEMRDPAQLAALKRLIRDRADVVLQNMRPGQVESLGLDGRRAVRAEAGADLLQHRRVRRKGPLKDRPGYDPLMQAFSGIMSTTGERGRPPVRVGPSIVDLGTGMWAVIGILTALRRAGEHGRGGVVDVSLFETAATWMSLLAAQLPGLGRRAAEAGLRRDRHRPLPRLRDARRRPRGRRRQRRACSGSSRRCWATRSGARTRASPPTRSGSRTRRCFTTMIEAEMRDARQAPSGSRCWKRPAFPAPRCRTSRRCSRTRRPARCGLLQDVPGSAMKFLGLPVSFDGERPPLRSRPPRLGEHTDDYLKRAQPARRPRPASRRPRSVG